MLKRNAIMLSNAAKLIHSVAVLLAHGEMHVHNSGTYYFIHFHILSLNALDILNVVE